MATEHGMKGQLTPNQEAAYQAHLNKVRQREAVALARRNETELQNHTGLNLKPESEATAALCKELGMPFDGVKADRDNGEHVKLVDSFSELAAAGKSTADRERIKQQALDRIDQFSDREGKDFSHFIYKFRLPSEREHWRKNRDKAYVRFARFAKEAEIMCNHVKEGYELGTDSQSRGKVKYANTFLECVRNIQTAMSDAGEISDGAREMAANVLPTTFPDIIAAASTPQEAFKLLQLGKTNRNTDDKPPREPVDTSKQQAELAAIRKPNEKLMQEWWALWKKYGKDASGITLKGNSPDIVADGLKALGVVLRAWADPKQQPKPESLEGFAAQLEAFVPSIQYLNAVQSRMSDAERQNMEAITLRFMEIMTLVNNAYQEERISPALIDSLLEAPKAVEADPVKLPIAPVAAAPAVLEVPTTMIAPSTIPKTPMQIARVAPAHPAIVAVPQTIRAPVKMSEQRTTLNVAEKGLFKEWDKLVKLHPLALQTGMGTASRKTIKDGIQSILAVFDALESPPRIPRSTSIQAFQSELHNIVTKIERALVQSKATQNNDEISNSYDALIMHLGEVHDIIEITKEKVQEVQRGPEK